jgi:multimeric flavodoxin WrbA
MKIVAVIGSGRRHGNTEQIVGLVQAQLERIAAAHGTPLEFETVCLGQQKISPCRGCRVCFDRGEERCPYHDDDMPAIKAKMKAADGILVASPVYVDDVSGLTKTWIDRLAHVCHRPEFAGRCAYAIATVASSPTGHTLSTLSMALRTWGFHLAGKSGFKMGALMHPEASAAQFTPQAAKIATALFNAIYHKQFVRPPFYSLMVFKIQQRAWRRSPRTDTIDYRYWQNQGWLEPACSFYIPHHTHPVKLALARAAGALIGPLVSD